VEDSAPAAKQSWRPLQRAWVTLECTQDKEGSPLSLVIIKTACRIHLVALWRSPKRRRIRLRIRPRTIGLSRRAVVKACCVGCGRTRKLRACSKCLTAKFCGAECVRRMWPVHKQSCKTFAAAREEAAAAADGGADEHGSAPAAV